MRSKGLYLIIFILQLGINSRSLGSQDVVHPIYAVLQTDDTLKINAQLKAIENTSTKEKDAYKGTLMMRKSGTIKKGMEKLTLFKKGRILLEHSIKQDSLNAEYRFLRLLIQEHVPDFLNYHSKKQEDAKLIRQSFKKLSPQLQEAIISYSKNSQILKPEDLQK